LDRRTDARSTLAFSERWLNKASRHDSSTLDGAFDKFFSLFVAFNRIYSYVNRYAKHPAQYDKTQATTGFSAAVRASRLRDLVVAGNGAADIIRDAATFVTFPCPGGRTSLCSIPLIGT